MKVITDEKRIDEFLERGVENIYPTKEELKKTLMSGKRLLIYNGIDPTGPTLHIGHGSTLLKLRELQNLGHQVVLLIGDFTGRIGDPTDKDAARKQLTKREVKKNLKSYTKQASKILDIKKTSIRFNSKWLSKLSFEDIIKIASEFTLQQMIERDMFNKRIKGGQPIHLHEFFYPLMQGYDSVAMGVDMEIGGNDQTFNMLVGRTMMKTRGKEKYVLTTKLLVDPTGKKMGKSEGNMVTLEDAPENMFGKIMSWPDTLINLAFEICTRVDKHEIEKTKAMNPRDAKMKLAYEIVKLYCGAKRAKGAEENFVNVFQKKETPDGIKEIIGRGELGVLCVKNAVVESMSQWRRLIDEGAIKKIEDNNETKITKYKQEAVRGVYKIGKRKFIKII